ncbi:hypothetical protein [Halococcus qingdaonensis]|uniref:hypothetical protein n=1 Tax=Halococcus qingdaonensis TaxID=224402 RepID=UPI0021160AC0|nr:hypothetical protein [Halococcus qingdaonensis]
MVDIAILTGVIGIIGTAIGAAIQGLASIRKARIMESERTERKRSEFYLQYKVDTLIDLHQKIVHLRSATSGYSTEHFDVEEMVPKFRDEKDNVMSRINAAQEAHTKAQIYLTAPESAIISRFIWQSINVCERMSEISGSTWADVSYDEEQYEEAFRNAHGVLKLAIDSPATEYFDDETVTDENAEEEIEKIERAIKDIQSDSNNS